MYRLLSLLVACGIAVAVAGPVSADRPNVILFIADDVSWNDYGCYGNTAWSDATITKCLGTIIA